MTPEAEQARGEQPSALERLRDRTDELELIISSLTIFALFSLPGWLLNRLAEVFTHLSTALLIASQSIVLLLSGFCYGLGACFVIHLMARAYWVGLIGLRAAFPDGINWDRTPNLGPITREHYRERLPDLGALIRSTDRVASSLFAVISMLTLTGLWFGTLLVVVMVVTGSIGARFGLTNAALNITQAVLLFMIFGASLVNWLLDAQLAARIPALRRNRGWRALVAMLRRIAAVTYPERLVMPVQLTLQSNTRPYAFFAILVVAVTLIISVGSMRVAGWRLFTISGEFTYLPNEIAEDGFRSTYYEDMAAARDRLIAAPRISSFVQAGSFIRLFLPYQPVRDNLILDQLCDGEMRSADPSACLERLWTVSMDGRDVSLSDFIVAQRNDLRMRGLLGLLPTEGLAPGLHTIEVVWNPDPEDTSRPIDDRYGEVSVTMAIPFAFAPDYELSLDGVGREAGTPAAP